MTTLTNNFENEVLPIGYVEEKELPEALLQSIDRGLKDLENGRKKSKEKTHCNSDVKAKGDDSDDE